MPTATEERKRMIAVTRLHGASVTLNCDLIERVESTPDTVLTLVDGSRYVVRESVGEIVDKLRSFRASVVLLASQAGARDGRGASPAPGLRPRRGGLRAPLHRPQGLGRRR
jgi:flagellar protein FlbD